MSFSIATAARFGAWEERSRSFGMSDAGEPYFAEQTLVAC